jgi:hypothetical protein
LTVFGARPHQTETRRERPRVSLTGGSFERVRQQLLFYTCHLPLYIHRSILRCFDSRPHHFLASSSLLAPPWLHACYRRLLLETFLKYKTP